MHYKHSVTTYINSKQHESGQVKQMTRPLIHVITISFNIATTLFYTCKQSSFYTTKMLHWPHN